MNDLDQAMYVAFHGKVYLKGATDSHRTGLKIQLTLEREDDYKLFKGFRKHRKGKHSTGLYRLYMKLEEEWLRPLDLWFKGWSLTPTHGTVLSFEMLHDDRDIWMVLRYKTKALEAGYRLDELNSIELLVAELDQEGKAINVVQRAKLEAMERKKKWGKGGPQSKRAARLCHETDFVGWLGETNRLNQATLTNEDVANWMRKEIDIDTRAQLDHDPSALERFEERIMAPFLRSQM